MRCSSAAIPARAHPFPGKAPNRSSARWSMAPRFDWGVNAAVLFGRQKADILLHTKDARYHGYGAHDTLSETTLTRIATEPLSCRIWEVSPASRGGYPPERSASVIAPISSSAQSMAALPLRRKKHAPSTAPSPRSASVSADRRIQGFFPQWRRVIPPPFSLPQLPCFRCTAQRRSQFLCPPLKVFASLFVFIGVILVRTLLRQAAYGG